MQGVPLRLEMKPQDIEQNQCVLVRRDNQEKQFLSLDNLEEAVETSLTACMTPCIACPGESP